MRARRRDSFRGTMVNYSHMLVAALSVTALVMLVKYRNLTSLMAEEEKEHMQNQKLLLDDLGKETDRTKMLNEELNKRMADIKKVEERLKGTQDELSNSINALQASNDQINELKSERQSLTDNLANAKEENSQLQIKVSAAQDELQKTKAMVDDNKLTIKDSQGKQEKLLNDNTRLSQELNNLQTENENLRIQVADSIKAAQTAETKVKELEVQLLEKAASKEEPKETQQKPKQQTNDKPEETKEEPKKDVPEEKKEETGNEVEKDTLKEPEVTKEEVKREANDGIPQGKNPDYKVDDKQIEKDIEVYDMLNEDEKAKLKTELENNELEVAGGGEMVDNPQLPEDDENVKAGNDVAAEDFNDGIPDNEDEALLQEYNAGKIEGDNTENEDIPAEIDGNVLPEPKAFEESGGSFDILKGGGIYSWQAESSI